MIITQETKIREADTPIPKMDFHSRSEKMVAAGSLIVY
jgi:hypothetical protein